MKQKSMASMNPQKISDNVWYYEEDKYLEFYMQHKDITGYTEVRSFRISKRKLEASLKRMNTPAKK